MSYELARASHLHGSCTGVPVGVWALFGRAFDVPGSFVKLSGRFAPRTAFRAQAQRHVRERVFTHEPGRRAAMEQVVQVVRRYPQLSYPS